jgi:uncharacterized paraquat-inducible protein A
MRKLRLRLSPRWPGGLAPTLLLSAFSLNVLALYLPFMYLRKGLSTSPYSLRASVEYLWDSGLFVLAVVVVAFSVLFPFVKLSVMAAILLGLVPESRERRALEFVERYGKWSMLDVFLVCIMLALANDQFFIDAEPRRGLLCFTAAILTSMLASGHMLARVQRRAPRPLAPLEPSRWRTLGQVGLFALLAAVLTVPFLEIDDWRLDDHPVSILSTIEGLWLSGARTLAVLTALFLAVAPLSVHGLMIAISRRARRDPESAGLRAGAQTARHWAMLDVFALALGIFLVEGREFVRTDLSWGAFLLALMLLFYWPLSNWLGRRL